MQMTYLLNLCAFQDENTTLISLAFVSIATGFILDVIFGKRELSSKKSKSKSSLSVSACSQPRRKLKIIVYIHAFCGISVHYNGMHITA